MIIEVRQGNTKAEQMQNIEKALKILKRKLEKDNTMRIIRDRKFYIKPSQLEHTRISKIERRRKLAKRKNK